MKKNNLDMYCLSMSPSNLGTIKAIGYLPVGLGDNKFSKNWLSDRFKKDISKKNKYYGEYTFHYKIWKKKLNLKNKWIGFCQYRKFWIQKNLKKKI